MGELTLIDVAQIKISQDPDEVLVVHNLGACLGVCVYDQKTGLAGIIHCLLPLSKSDPEKAQQNPSMYVDTGVALLLDQMFARGADRTSLTITVAGGSNMSDQNNVFEIGKKNFTILKKILWKHNLLIKAEHIGDALSRTISLHVGTGKTFVKVQGETFELA